MISFCIKFKRTYRFPSNWDMGGLKTPPHIHRQRLLYWRSWPTTSRPTQVSLDRWVSWKETESWTLPNTPSNSKAAGRWHSWLARQRPVGHNSWEVVRLKRQISSLPSNTCCQWERTTRRWRLSSSKFQTVWRHRQSRIASGSGIECRIERKRWPNRSQVEWKLKSLTVSGCWRAGDLKITCHKNWLFYTPCAIFWRHDRKCSTKA